jgi:hypothetical protein
MRTKVLSVSKDKQKNMQIRLKLWKINLVTLIIANNKSPHTIGEN